MNFYAFHLGDYVSATAHLTWDEDMAYRRLLDAYYSREAPIPLDQRQAYRLARASTQEQREAVDSVLQEFFEETESGWLHSRCESEIHAVAGKRDKASQSAKARWRKANAMPTQCEVTADAMRTESERNANASENPCERIENGCEGNAPIPTPIPNKSKELAAVVTAPKPRRKTKSALPTPFLLSTDMAKWARERAPRADLNLETEKFCNHWRAKGETRADWHATWRNWMLNAQQFAGRRQRPIAEPDFEDTSWANDLGPL